MSLVKTYQHGYISSSASHVLFTINRILGGIGELTHRYFWVDEKVHRRPQLEAADVRSNVQLWRPLCTPECLEDHPSPVWGFTPWAMIDCHWVLSNAMIPADYGDWRVSEYWGRPLQASHPPCLFRKTTLSRTEPGLSCTRRAIHQTLESSHQPEQNQSIPRRDDCQPMSKPHTWETSQECGHKWRIAPPST